MQDSRSGRGLSTSVNSGTLNAEPMVDTPAPDSPSVFARFTERSRQVAVLAQEYARTLRHAYIGTEHILLGLLREDQGIAARVLQSLDITEDLVRRQIVADVGLGDVPMSGQIPFTLTVKKLFDQALREAMHMGDNYIGTEHILLSLVHTPDSSGAKILLNLGVALDAIADEVIRLLSGPGGRRSVTRETSIEAGPSQSEAAAATGDAPADQTDPLLPPEPEDAFAQGLEAVPTHADRPATRDELGRARLAEVLAERTRRVRGEDTEGAVDGWRARRRKIRRDGRAARLAGSFMIHIHAPWGSGKSSLLNFYAENLRNFEPRPGRSRARLALDLLFRRRRARDPQLSQWIVVKFGAWEHQRLEPPWWWLLAAIRRSAARELWRINRGRWLWFWLRDVSWWLWNARAGLITALLVIGLIVGARALDWFGLEGSSLTALKTTAVSVGALITLGSAVWGRIRGTSRTLAFGSADGAVRFLQRAQDPLGIYRRRFRWLVRSTGRPLVVLVDDLDRCKADYVVALLEGIQTLFADEPVTFVVAADRTWLCESFAKVYSDFGASVGDAGRPLGYLFLEKSFQISMELPPMSFEDRRRYWRSLTRPADVVSAAEDDRTSRLPDDAFASARTQEQVEERIATLLASAEDDEEVLRAAVRKLNAPEMQAQLEDLLREFAPLLENNPRSMKRLINAYGIERDRLLREQRLPSPEERKRLVLFTILRLRWPRLAAHLLCQSEDAALFAEGAELPEQHAFASLLRDPDVRALFNGSVVDVRLDGQLLDRYAGRAPEDVPSIGA